MPKIIDDDELKPYWSTTDGEHVRIFHGDVLETLRKMPSQSVHCVTTSPPYWGLRDYGTGEWQGGDPKCDHGIKVSRKRDDLDYSQGGMGSWSERDATVTAKHECKKCGAKRIDRQLGSEKLPDCLGWARGENCAEKDWGSACHTCRMVLVFRELRRVLRDDGVLWVNYGSTYFSGSSSKNDFPKWKSGDLIMVPALVALALQQDGWTLRQDIIWNKPGPMPESVRNRCSKSHEYVFLLTKGMGYYYDAEAIKEKAEYGYVDTPNGVPKGDRKAKSSSLWRHAGDGKESPERDKGGEQSERTFNPESGRNKRSVWTVASKGYEGSHFACYPPKLIEPMILAGTSEKGCCSKCGSPWKRILETNYIPHGENAKSQRKTNGANCRRDDNGEVAGNIRPQEMTHGRATREDKTIGWRPSCECHGKIVKRKIKVKGQAINDGRVDGGIPNGWDVGKHTHSTTRYNTDGEHSDKEGQRQKAAQLASDEREETVEEYVSDLPLEDHPIVPCTVLDPFLGSGTTCCVAITHGRRSVGIELSESYIKENAIVRITGALMDRPSLASLSGRKIEKVKSKGNLLK